MSITQNDILRADFLDEDTRVRLDALRPDLTAVEVLKLKKAIQLKSESLIKLILLKHKRVKSRDLYTFENFSWSELESQIHQMKPNDYTASSLLANDRFMGGEVNAIAIKEAPQLKNIDDLKSLDQLAQLDTTHIQFSVDENVDQKIAVFGQKITSLFGNLGPLEKRSYLYVFMKSPLFYKYIFTGLVALNIQSNTPSKALLNVLHQNDSRFLSLYEFNWTSLLVKTVRSTMAL